VIAARECRAFLQEHRESGPVTFALFGAAALAVYQALLARP
jgi:hypothetical protein